MNTEVKNIKSRLVGAFATKGGPGKSATLSGIGQWASQRGISWVGWDLDCDHRTFSRTLPVDVQLWEIGNEAEDDAVKLLRRCLNLPMALVDPRAHMNNLLVQSMGLIRFQETYAKQDGRVTALLFPQDDLEVMTDMDTTISILGNSVDYIVVRNPARIPRTRMFDGSELETELQRLGAGFLEVPVLLSLARNHVATVEAQLGRGLSAVEAIANRELPIDGMVRVILEDWIKTFFRRLDQVAHLLLHAEGMKNIAQNGHTFTPAAAVLKRGNKINQNQL